MEAVFDTSWKQRALGGNSEAVRLLASQALTPLYQFCLYRVGRRRDLCEDVVQETLVRAIGSLANYEPQRADGNIFPWLSGLARNEIRRVLSKEQSAASLESMWAHMDDELRTIFASIDSEALDDEVLRREETREMVGATMSQLPSHYREALESKYIDRKTVHEMAQEQSTSEKAVESLLSRARRAFRETFLALDRNLDMGTQT